jgi:hypothetical protein
MKLIRRKYISISEVISLSYSTLRYCMGAFPWKDGAGKTKVGSINVPLNSCLTGLESAV